MTILITRPAPHGVQLQQQLNKLGIASCYTPLINIDAADISTVTKLKHYFPQLRSCDKIIALSPQVSYQQPLLNHPFTWPSAPDYYAIGRQSARLFATLTQQVINYPAEAEISEALLALPHLQQVAKQHILLLRGNGGRELLAKTLNARGAYVHCITCYHRHTINYDVIQLQQHWHQQQIKAIVVTSEQILNQLMHVLEHSFLYTTWLQQLPLVTVSQRLVQLAQRLGWNHVYTSHYANNQAIIECILSLNLNMEPSYG